MNPMNGVKALFFDVFGTLVDWRSGVARDVELVPKPHGYSIFARPQEHPGVSEAAPRVAVDVMADSIEDLAAKPGSSS